MNALIRNLISWLASCCVYRIIRRRFSVSKCPEYDPDGLLNSTWNPMNSQSSRITKVHVYKCVRVARTLLLLVSVERVQVSCFMNISHFEAVIWCFVFLWCVFCVCLEATLYSLIPYVSEPACFIHRAESGLRLRQLCGSERRRKSHQHSERTATANQNH